MRQVSVVIPAVQYDIHLESCLKSLLVQENVKLDVWVVFNPKIPKFNSVQWPNWIQFVQSKKGVNCARNLGLAKCVYENVLFLDSDCELIDPTHIEKLMTFLSAFPEATGVGGDYDIPGEANLPSQAYHYLQAQWLRQQILSEDFSTRALFGGHMLLRKSQLEDFRFDEKIVFGGSEKEFFCRMYAAQKKFFVNLKLSVQHNSNISETQLLQKAKAQGRGEKYIRSLHGKSVQPKFCFILKRKFDPAWKPLIEKYQTVYSNAAGDDLFKVNPIKKFIFNLIEHLMVSQSSKD